MIEMETLHLLARDHLHFAGAARDPTELHCSCRIPRTGSLRDRQRNLHGMQALQAFGERDRPSALTRSWHRKARTTPRADIRSTPRSEASTPPLSAACRRGSRRGTRPGAPPETRRPAVLPRYARWEGGVFHGAWSEWNLRAIAPKQGLIVTVCLQADRAHVDRARPLIARPTPVQGGAARARLRRGSAPRPRHA